MDIFGGGDSFLLPQLCINFLIWLGFHSIVYTLMSIHVYI